MRARRKELDHDISLSGRGRRHPGQVFDSPVAVAEDEDCPDGVALSVRCCSVDVCDEDLAVDAIEVRLEVMGGPFGGWRYGSCGEDLQYLGLGGACEPHVYPAGIAIDSGTFHRRQ